MSCSRKLVAASSTAVAVCVYKQHNQQQTDTISRIYEWQRAVNMSSKRCCVLAVVCLSVMLLSLDADAQPPVDNDSSQCGSALLQQVANMVETLPNMIGVIASNQQAMMDEMKNESGRVRAEMEDVKRLVLSRPTECECATVKPPEYSTYPAVTTSTSPPEPSAHLSVSMLFDCGFTTLLNACTTERMMNGWGKGGNVTSARWQVTLCDPMWHVSSRSGVATLRTAIPLLLTYLPKNPLTDGH